ncbi:TadE/TadG family type IV pilus assembly protein [Cellulomonas soli]|uniref:TadE/TadG family type IV pilus assembly protein n=1 Tax=Cellulomonas soli TaxID=931535 RepID=UPI003F86EE4E
MTVTRDRGDRERGSSAIELLGVLPVVVVVLLALLQTIAVTYTTHATNQAVRDGARAMSLGRPVAAAVERSLPGGLEAQQITYPDGGVRIEVRVPRIAVFPGMTVTREAAMPRTAP